MRVETTIALSEDLLRVVDDRSASFGGRSQLIEAAIRAFVGISKTASGARAVRSARQTSELPVYESRPLAGLPSRTDLYNDIFRDDSES